MKIVFIGQLYSDEQYVQFYKKGWQLDNAADTLQKLMISGIRNNGNYIDVVSFPRVPCFPTAKNTYFKSVKYNLRDGLFTSLGFINIPFLKHLSKALFLYKWLKHNYANKTDLYSIIVYSLHSPLLIPFLFLKNTFPIVLIVPDLPAFMSASKNIIYKIGKKIDRCILKLCLNKIDGFVLLSDSMNDVLNKQDKPWIRIEGICDENNNSTISNSNIDYPYILYTGSLDSRYGILNLIKAFTNAKTGNVKLIICGKGDSEDELKNISKKNKTIIFKGQVPRIEAIALQRNAIFLINPRISEGEYTKYSFPSKTMEYLASGRPVLMYRLPGIPSEYHKYFFSPEDESIEALSLKIEQILQIPETDLSEFGRKAKEFVLTEKNSNVQTLKILNLITSLLNKPHK